MSCITREKSIRWALDAFGYYCCSVKGTSMLPMLRQGVDTVAIERACDPSSLAPFDVILFQRSDGSYVLHRIVRLEQDANSLLVCGDNCETTELVAYSQVLGVMTKFFRGERETTLDSWGYRAYVTLCCRPWRARILFNRALHIFQRASARIARRVPTRVLLASRKVTSGGR